MATAAPSSAETPVQKKQPVGLWDSLSPSEQKKAVTVFLCSLGVTLLITGRSGGNLLKRAKATETSADTAATSSSAAAPRREIKSAARPRPPPPAPTPSMSATPPTTPAPPRPQAPPVSFLHPNALTPPAQPRPRRRLLASFILPPSSPSPPSVLPSSSHRSAAPSSYFLPNPTIVARSTAFADELDKYDKLHEDGAPLPPPSEDDGFNPAWFAFKALAIATALSVGTFAAGIYGVMRYLGVDDVSGARLANFSLSLSLTRSLPSYRSNLWRWHCSIASRPSLTRTALPSPIGRPLLRLLLKPSRHH